MRPFKSSEWKPGMRVRVKGGSHYHPDVHILTVNGRGEQPVIGYIGNGTTVEQWGLDGSFGTQNGINNLVFASDPHGGFGCDIEVLP